MENNMKMAKISSTELPIWHLLSCILFVLFLLPGGNGYINDYPVGRFLRDAKLNEIGGGTTEIRKLIIGRAFNEAYGGVWAANHLLGYIHYVDFV